MASMIVASLLTRDPSMRLMFLRRDDGANILHLCRATGVGGNSVRFYMASSLQVVHFCDAFTRCVTQHV
jgi:hypothetical protein